MAITQDIQDAILQLPERVWEPAYDAGGQARPGAWVAELTGDMVRVMGPDHPDALATRSNIASWAAQSGANAEHESEANPDDLERESKITDRESANPGPLPDRL
jgi:hypothetical protein